MFLNHVGVVKTPAAACGRPALISQRCRTAPGHDLGVVPGPAQDRVARMDRVYLGENSLSMCGNVENHDSTMQTIFRRVNISETGAVARHRFANASEARGASPLKREHVDDAVADIARSLNPGDAEEYCGVVSAGDGCHFRDIRPVAALTRVRGLFTHGRRQPRVTVGEEPTPARQRAHQNCRRQHRERPAKYRQPHGSSIEARWMPCGEGTVKKSERSEPFPRLEREDEESAPSGNGHILLAFHEE